MKLCRRYLLLLLAGILASVASSQEKPSKKSPSDAQSRFVQAAFKRLGVRDTNPEDDKTKKSPQDRFVFGDSKTQGDLEERYKAWVKSPNDKTWEDLAEGIQKGALKNEKPVRSILTVKTRKGAAATEGATVKYQAIWSRSKKDDPTTAKNPTECKEDLVVGVYYVWSERDGKPTSDRNAKFFIVAKEEKLTLAEN